MLLYICPQKGTIFFSMKNHLNKVKNLIERNLIRLYVVSLASIGLVGVTAPAMVFFEVNQMYLIDSVDSGEVRELELKFEAAGNDWAEYGDFPKSELVPQPRYSVEIPVTAYSSDVWQTDDTPFITASQTRVRDGVIAANFLEIGTRVRFPELYGDKVFIVEDRMNERYYYHADIWMPKREQAVNFGVEYTTVEIF